MEGWRDRRGPLPAQPEGNEAEVRKFPQGRKAKPRQRPAAEPGPNNWGTLADIGFPPEPHEPAELMNQDDLDALQGAGFEPHDRGVWHRPTPGDETGAGHYVYYNPGRKVGDKVKPWHLINDSEEGRDFSTLRGMSGALSNIKHFSSAIPDWTKFGAKATPGQSAADKWLADNDNDDWMREREGDPDEGYTHWEPNENDYTYRDFGDAAGQSFHGDEAQSHVLPGLHYHNDADWETGLRHEPSGQQEQSARWQPHEYDDNTSEEERDRIDQKLADNGFNWEAHDETAGSPENPLSPETPGKWVKHQLDTEGNHVATHTLTNDEGHQPGQWSVHTELGTHGLPVTFSHSVHGAGENGLDWALEKYKNNAAEAMLPNHGYERGPGGVWSRTDETPHGTYEHEIFNSDHEDGRGGVGFTGNTVNPEMRLGSRDTHSHDLADVVREQHRMSQGLHPGGPQDHRLSRSELLSDPTVARLGAPARVSDNFHGDGKVGSASWQFPHPEGHAQPVNAEATYNWDKGGYDFKYTHDGVPLAASHNAVPAGAPAHVPGRQLSLPLESVR